VEPETIPADEAVNSGLQYRHFTGTISGYENPHHRHLGARAHRTAFSCTVIRRVISKHIINGSQPTDDEAHANSCDLGRLWSLRLHRPPPPKREAGVASHRGQVSLRVNVLQSRAKKRCLSDARIIGQVLADAGRNCEHGWGPWVIGLNLRSGH